MRQSAYLLDWEVGLCKGELSNVSDFMLTYSAIVCFSTELDFKSMHVFNVGSNIMLQSQEVPNQ